MFQSSLFTTIVFFVFSVTVHSQISVSVMVSDSVRQVPMPFVNVMIVYNNAPIAGGQTDVKGHYSFMVTETGKYQMKAKYMNSTCSTGVFDIRSDTIILLKMHRPLQYEAPCRQKVNDNEVIMDVPAEHYDNCEFRRIMTTTEKLGFDFLMDRTENTNIRLWTEPAFDYYGGKVTNVTETGNGWIFNTYSIDLITLNI